MPAESVEVRPARSGDVDQVWPLVEQFAVSYQPEQAIFERSFDDLLARSDTLILVAEDAPGTVVGYLLASCNGTFSANGPVAWVEELMVSETARHQGIAKRLIASAETWARGIPAAYVALASRRAGDFYLKIGYEESATYFRKTFAPPRA
jgi:predicted N-acetyltransferase YhbS